MDAEWYGSEDGAFFDFDSVSKNRRIKYPMLPNNLASKVNNSQLVKIPPKQNGEVRILTTDIALMSSKKNNNDATAIFIIQLVPSKSGHYMKNVVYCDAAEGLHTEDQALMIRKLYDEFFCDYIVIDTNGVGLGCFDCLVREMVDSDSGIIYQALSCCNDKVMADRCTVQNAEKVIWSIKANAAMNSDCAFMLREGFRSGQIRLLMNEYEGDELLSNIRGYDSMSPSEKIKLQMPYIHTTLLIDELVKLEYEESNGRIKISERSGMRKDRYSALSYGYYVALQLESKLQRKQSSLSDMDGDQFIIKAPAKSINKGKVVNGYGRSGGRSYGLF